MRFVFLSVCILLVFACGGNKIPDNIIQVNDMKFIMWDLTRTGEYLDIRRIKDTSKIKPSVTFSFQQVFSLHKVKKDDFYRSLKFYQSHPELNKILFDSLAAYANRERTELYKKRQ